jgi:phage-related protein
MNWIIEYYNSSVFGEIAALPKKLWAKSVAITNRMQEQGPHLGMPYVRAMGNSLFEIRVKSHEGIARIFFCLRRDKTIVLLHAYVKKSQKTPTKELNLAIERMKEVKRYELQTG